MNLHWYKTDKPVMPYILRDVSTMFTGYSKKQDLPERDYYGFGTYEDCYRINPSKAIRSRKWDW